MKYFYSFGTTKQNMKAYRALLNGSIDGLLKPAPDEIPGCGLAILVGEEFIKQAEKLWQAEGFTIKQRLQA